MIRLVGNSYMFKRVQLGLRATPSFIQGSGSKFIASEIGTVLAGHNPFAVVHKGAPAFQNSTDLPLSFLLYLDSALSLNVLIRWIVHTFNSVRPCDAVHGSSVTMS